MLTFILGLVIGGTLGLIITCMCVISRESDHMIYQIETQDE